MNNRLPPENLTSALLTPRSVALVGASDDPTKTAGRPQQFLRKAGFQGRIYPINAKRATVQETPAWPSLEALPEVPDQVFVMTPTESVLDVVGQCVKLGVPLVTVLASGFSESGPEGVERENALRKLVAESGTRLLGPSSLGVVQASSGLMLTANAAFAEPDVPAGRLFVASHSGSMLGALVSRGKARGVGFAGMVSVGSEVDLSIGEICESTLDNPSIDGYLLFIESLRHGAQLQSFAREAVRRGKPVIAYKLGRSSAAAEMAATHTGAIAGEDDVADAFLKDLGIARVDQFETLLETLPLAQRMPLPSSGSPRQPLRVGVVTTTGGGSAMVVDQLGVRGIDVTPATPATLERLAAAGVSVPPGRVLDLTLAGTRYDVMKTVLDVLLEAPEFDLIVSVVGSSARFQPNLAVQPLLDSAHHPRPLAAMLVPDAPGALAMLTSAGVPCFRSPETCADAIAAVAARRPPGTPAAPQPATSVAPRPISEADAYGVLDALGVPHAPVMKVDLSAQAPALAFDFPLVAKVCSAEIPHKTEVGGVVLGIQDQTDLTAALQTLQKNLSERAPGIVCNEALIQPMVKGLAEVLVGYRVDPEAGPIVMLAAGGIWAEVARDRSIRLAPVSIETAREMVDEVRALATVRGLRGKPKGDLEALAAAVSALSQLAVRPEFGITEAEVNPMLVMPEGQGVMAVDALVLK